MKALIIHPSKVCVIKEFEALPLCGQEWEYDNEYFEEVVGSVMEWYNLKRSYQLTNILFRWTVLIIDHIKWVSDNDKIIPHIYVKRCDDKRDYRYGYESYWLLRKFIDRNGQWNINQ